MIKRLSMTLLAFIVIICVGVIGPALLGYAHHTTGQSEINDGEYDHDELEQGDNDQTGYARDESEQRVGDQTGHARVALETEAPQILPTPDTSAPALVGLNFGPFRDGRDPTRGAVTSPAEIEDSLLLLKPHTTWIRTYGTGNGLDQVGKIAHQLGLKVAVGAWLGRDHAANDREIARLIQLGQAGEIDIAVVGNETLLRGDLSVSQLISYVTTVQEALLDIPVTTAESHHLLLRHPALVQAVDVVFMHHYPYWNGIPIERAMTSLVSEYTKLTRVAGDKTVWVAETGWPSGGDTIGLAVPSPENAARYLQEFLTWAGDDVPYLYFAAFDEPWKAAHEGPQGAHWGLWDRFGKLKPEIRDVLDLPMADPND